ncbi:MAG TPA: hypothetical protein PKC44_13705, partial [Agitococcus sp.]|nr:hypothetical protein [Agitococcus sp.]
FVYIILLAPTKNKILNLSIVAGFSVLLGILLGGGWHYWQVWCEFGNPFYPFFNQIWHSPSYPAEALVNDRFVRKTPLEWLLLPLQMLLPYDFITIEKMNVDPRYLIIGVLTIIVILIFMIQLITRQYLEKNNISVGEKKHIITFMIYFWFSYILWCVTSGNGRYGVPLHLSIGALVAFLYISLAIKNNKKYLIILFATIISVFTSILTWKESHWNRVQHTDKWYNFVISPQSKISSATYVSVGYMDRTSYSYLIPFLPSDARFISINGYANLNATEFAGKQALGVLKKYKNYPVMLIAEPRKRELAEIPAEYWMKNINLNLKQFGLQITSEKNCQPVINGFNQRIVAEICFLNHVAEDNSAQKSQIDNFYDRLEQVNAKLLRPTIDKSYYRNGNYCRFYTATEIYVCTDDTNIWWMRVAPVSLQMIGKVSEVLMTHPPKLNEL